MYNEQVFAIDIRLLNQVIGDLEEGLIQERLDVIIDLLFDEGIFVDRPKVEQDDGFKQIIPYAIVQCGDSFLLLKRTNQQGEKRLHFKMSLGIGGHINPSEVGKSNILFNGLLREMNEEIYLPQIKTVEFVGFINDSSTDVGRHHLGACYMITLLNPVFNILETNKMTASFVPREHLMTVYDDMESWSQIVMNTLILSLL
jgi:predicted NUDIX family phosphoesterase